MDQQAELPDTGDNISQVKQRLSDLDSLERSAQVRFFQRIAVKSSPLNWGGEEGGEIHKPKGGQKVERLVSIFGNGEGLEVGQGT